MYHNIETIQMSLRRLFFMKEGHGNVELYYPGCLATCRVCLFVCLSGIHLHRFAKSFVRRLFLEVLSHGRGVKTSNKT